MTGTRCHFISGTRRAALAMHPRAWSRAPKVSPIAQVPKQGSLIVNGARSAEPGVLSLSRDRSEL